MITVRKATEKDSETIALFNRRMAQETEDKRLDPNTVASGVTEVLRSPEKGFYLVAETDSRVVAQLLITTEWSDWRHGDFWWIQSVYVDPPYRRKGVYRTLHETVVEMAKSQEGVCGIRLYVDRSNSAALDTYSRLNMLQTQYVVMEQEF
ncbi:MAG: GNAT family N-acetyltransferase [Fidelibacterota bacterium]